MPSSLGRLSLGAPRRDADADADAARVGPAGVAADDPCRGAPLGAPGGWPVDPGDFSVEWEIATPGDEA